MPRKRPADKQYVMTIRLSPRLRKVCAEAAEARGMLLSQFLRHAAAVLAAMPVGRELDFGYTLPKSMRNKRGEVISPMDEQGSR